MLTQAHRRSVGAPSLALDNDELARDYERMSSTRQFESGQKLLAEMNLAPGDRVLDIGCGTGLLTEYIADVVGPEGDVVGIDPLPLRIEIARQKRRPNLTFEVSDAYDLDTMRDGSFDAVVMNAVFHWLPEKTRPLLEAARVLRPGGRIGISTQIKGVQTRVYDVADKVLSEPPFDRYPRPRPTLVMGVDSEQMRAYFEMTGFSPLKIDVREFRRTQPSPDAAIRSAETSSFGNFLGHLPVELRGRARTTIRQRLQALLTPDGIQLELQRLVAVAVRR